MPTKTPKQKAARKTATENNPPTAPRISLIQFGDLRADPINQRRKMDPVKLEELKDSIDSHGIRSALEVRTTDEKGTYEVVTGNRRLAASGILIRERSANCEGKRGMEMNQAKAALAHATAIPCKILTPEEAKQAKYLQLIENLMREDISAQDEADGYHWLIENEEATPTTIAKETGKNVNHIRQRLKMRLCQEQLLDALDRREISAKHCELVGKIPTKSDRAEIAKRILDPELHDRPLTVAETEELIETDYMIRLNRRGGCPFDKEDPELDPKAGPCTTCRFLTANNPDFEGQLANPGKGIRGIDPNICTNPACFRKKAEAAWEATAAQERDAGNRVLSKYEAEKTFGGHEGEIAYNSEFVEATAKPQEQDTGHFGNDSLPTWKELLQKRGIEMPLVIAQHPTSRKRVELIDRQAATDAINAADGEQSPFANKPVDHDGKKQQSKDDRERKRRREKFAATALTEIATKLNTEPLKDEILIALIAVNLQEQKDSLWFLKLLLEAPTASTTGDDVDEIAAIVESLKGERRADLETYLAMTILAPSARWDGEEDPHLIAFATATKVDLANCHPKEA